MAANFRRPSAISHDNHILRYYIIAGAKLESKSQPTFSRGNCLPLPMQSSRAFEQSSSLGGVGSDGKLSCFMASRRVWRSGALESAKDHQRPPKTTMPGPSQRTSTVSQEFGCRPKRISRLATRRILAAWGGSKSQRRTSWQTLLLLLAGSMCLHIEMGGSNRTSPPRSCTKVNEA